ncbi:hypothetical protein SPD89_10695 [Pseudogracilibacillus sp. SO30301A]
MILHHQGGIGLVITYLNFINGQWTESETGETAHGVAILRYYAGEDLRSVGDVAPFADKDALMYTTRAP